LITKNRIYSIVYTAVFILFMIVGIYFVIKGLLPVYPGLSGSENNDSYTPLLDTVLFGFFIMWGSLIAIIFGYKILTRPEISKSDSEG
jgi:hypothetical protein